MLNYFEIVLVFELIDRQLNFSTISTACVAIKAPKAKQVEVKLTKAQFDDLLAKCKNNEREFSSKIKACY